MENSIVLAGFDDSPAARDNNAVGDRLDDLEIMAKNRQKNRYCCCRPLKRSSTCARTVTSRAETGSPATMNLGLPINALAIAMRWR